MLTREDCLALCELSEEEVEAIVEHEHIPELLAVELGQYLYHTPDGEARIERMIIADIGHARAHGNYAHMAKLVGMLRHFVEIQPRH